MFGAYIKKIYFVSINNETEIISRDSEQEMGKIVFGPLLPIDFGDLKVMWIDNWGAFFDFY